MWALYLSSLVLLSLLSGLHHCSHNAVRRTKKAGGGGGGSADYSDFQSVVSRPAIRSPTESQSLKWGPTIGILTSPLGNFDAHYHLRTTVLESPCY